jgi:hypothetical protein
MNSGTHYRARVCPQGGREILIEPGGFLSRESAKAAARAAGVRWSEARITVQYGHLSAMGKFDYWKDDLILLKDGSFQDAQWVKRNGIRVDA